MHLTVDMPVLNPFKPLYKLPEGTWLVICIGGRGGAKSYEVSRFLTLQATTRGKRCAILRDEQSTIAQSILHEIKSRFSELNEKLFGLLALGFDMQDKGLKNRQTNTLQIFTKGFKTSSSGKKASLKSIADVDIAAIEEFEDITDESKFNTFADSIRKEGSFIIINSNPPNKNHWFVKRYFNLLETEYEGYYALSPKDIPGVVYIFTGFEDNPHLSEHTVAKYRAYGNPDSEMYNPDHYCSDILGLVSEGARGRVYKNFQPITVRDFNELPYPSFYGLDFGFSNDPTALTEIKSHNQRNFWRERLYLTGLTNPELAERMHAIGITKRDLIYADSADPLSIQELRRLGFNVVPALKGPDSIVFGIKTIQSMENYATEDSRNLWHEVQEYRWQLDADGVPTDKPVDKFNHSLDGGRYAITMNKGRSGKIHIANENGPTGDPFFDKLNRLS